MSPSTGTTRTARIDSMVRNIHFSGVFKNHHRDRLSWRWRRG
jgi:hypothetical protein